MLRRRATFLAIATAAGAGLAGTLYAGHDHDAVSAALARIGWVGIAAAVAWRAVPLLLDAAGWRAAFPSAARPPLRSCWWMRWISESVNALLPVAQIGGEVVRARLVSRRWLVPKPRVRPGEAGAVVVVDMTLGVVATTVFSLAGAALLLSGGGAAGPAWWGLLGLLALLAVLVAVQKSGAVGWLARRVGGGIAQSVAVGADRFDHALAEAWADPPRLGKAVAFRVAGSFATAGEVWLALWAMGAPISLGDAVMLESLSFAMRTAAFVVPGGLGVQEATLLLVGQAAGLAPEQALAVALVKRVRELAVGLPGLAAWWAIEARHAVLVSATPPEPGSPPGGS